MRQTNLAAPPTPLVGRQRELADLAQLCLQPGVRLVTLTGPGGVGKTHLAQQVAVELSSKFDDAWFVALSAITDPSLVLPTIAVTLNLREGGKRPLLERLQQALNHRKTLLILDNFEQVLSAAPDLPGLLTGCPELKIMVTSRAVLRPRGEYEYPVPPLVVPEAGDINNLTAANLGRYEALALFVERARAVKPGFTVTNQNAPVIGRICVRLDGLPLAIELAAARIKLLPPAALLFRLQDSLELLKNGPADLPARQQTLRATLDWSYNLLTPLEKSLFQQLAVFSGGCSLHAAAAVARPETPGVLDITFASQELPSSMLELAGSLVDKSLLRPGEQSLPGSQEEAEPRLVFLETIREYGLDQLKKEGFLEVTGQRHSAYFIELAGQAEPFLNGPRQGEWLARLEADHANLRAALRRLLDGGQPAKALQLAGLLGRFWLARGYLSEGLSWLEETLSAGIIENTAETLSYRAKALAGASVLSNYLGDYRRSLALGQESLQIYRDLGDKVGCAMAMVTIGHAMGVLGDYETSKKLGEESIALMRELGNRWGLANSLWYNGNVCWMKNEHARARELFEESMALNLALNNQMGASYARMNLAHVDISLGELAKARPQLVESLEVMEGLGDKRGIARCFYGLGQVSLARGEYDDALAHFKKGLEISADLGDRFFIANFLEYMAGAIAGKGCYEVAARFMGGAAALRDLIEGPMAPVAVPVYQRNLALIRANLAPARFEETWGSGNVISIKELLKEALEWSPPTEKAQLPAQPIQLLPEILPATAGITARELAVLRLLAQGLTDAGIAERLSISSKTVHSHVASIYSKLDLSSRSAATRYALDHNLI